MRQMPPPASGHGLHINYKPYTGGPYTGLCGNICHDHTVPRWDEQATPTWTWDAGQMNGTPSQVGNLAMVFDNPLGEATYYAVANRPTMYNTYGTVPSKSIIGRALVLYEETDDFGTVVYDGTNSWERDMSIFFGSCLNSIACCNITLFSLIEEAEPVSTDTKHEKHRRVLTADDGVEVELLTLEEYKKIFGVEFDPADWTPEAFTE